MKYEDWVRYEARRKKGVSGPLTLLKIKKKEEKRAPNREIVPQKRYMGADVIKNLFEN